jgi:C4-dicarboxylate transporter DctM subunit
MAELAGAVPLTTGRIATVLDRLSAAFDAVALRVATLILAALILLVATQVAFRYGLNRPITWSEELATYLFAWLIFLGATVSIRRRDAPALRVVVDWVPASAGMVLQDTADLLGLAISAGLVWQGGHAAVDLMAQRTPAMQIPMGLPILVMPLAMAGFVLHYAARITRRFEAAPGAMALAAVIVAIAILLPAVVVPDDWPVTTMLAAILFGFAIGLPVGLVLTWAVVAVLLAQDQPLLIVPEQMFTAASNFILTAIPFFMFTGAVMQLGGMAERLVGFAATLMGRMRGGLLQADIVASAIFADMSGSAVSDTVAIGNVMLPGMVRRGYDPPFATALQAASGTLGVLFPPSIATIIYAWVANTSVADMFLASFLPAILVALSFAVIAWWHARRHDYPRERRTRLPDLVASFRATGWALLTPVLILGGILSGAVTPTEAGVLAALYALLISAVVYRSMTGARLRESLEHAVMGTARVMFVLAAAMLLGWEMIMLQVPQTLADGMLSLSHSPLVLLLILNLALILIHGVMETSATLILIVPLVLPIFTGVGVDPIHLGIVFLVNSALGLLTPPLGLVLYVAAPITGLSVERVARAALPFMLALLVDLAIVVLIPWISTVVPALVHR